MTDVRPRASDRGATRSPEDVLHQVLEPGERIIWSGRPDVSAMVEGVSTKRFALPGPLVVLATTVAAAWFIARRQGLDVGALLEALTRDGAWVYALAVVVIMLLPLILRMAGVDLSGAKPYRKWARSLTYGITWRTRGSAGSASPTTWGPFGFVTGRRRGGTSSSKKVRVEGRSRRCIPGTVRESASRPCPIRSD
jgi:hypothetical protein